VISLLRIPLSSALGWLHIKESPAYSSEVDIGVEANPWYYKWPPGTTMEVIGPSYLELLLQMKLRLEAQGILQADDKARLLELERKFRLLNQGGSVGRLPRGS